MKTLTGSYKAEDGLDYFELALNLKTKEAVFIKNAGCKATAEKIACEYFKIECDGLAFKAIKIFFQGNNKKIKLSAVPKKYHRFIK